MNMYHIRSQETCPCAEYINAQASENALLIATFLPKVTLANHSMPKNPGLWYCTTSRCTGIGQATNFYINPKCTSLSYQGWKTRVLVRNKKTLIIWGELGTPWPYNC